MDQFLNLQNQQQHEQITAAIREMAGVLHEYHRNLRDAGFSDPQAFAMTIALQGQLISTGKQQQEGA